MTRSAERRHRLARKLERPAGRAKPIGDAREHPAETLRAVGGQQAHPLLATSLDVVGQRPGERLGAEHGGLALVEHPEARVKAGLEGVRTKESVAEAVDRRDPAAVQVAREVVPLDLDEPLPDTRPQLAGGALRVRDDEDVVDPEAALADRLDEALHKHGRLPGPGPGRDEDDARLVDRGDLLLARGPHARLTRHIVQREHQRGHSPPRGSVRTSPACTRSTADRARS